MPTLDDMDSVASLLTLCVLAYLGNALDGQTYRIPDQEEDDRLSHDEQAHWHTHDVNVMSYVDRARCTYVRGIARVLVTWLGDTFELTRAGYYQEGGSQMCLPEDLQQFGLRWIAHMLVGVIEYKKKATPENQEYPSCTTSMLEVQVKECFGMDDPLYNAFSRATANWQHDRQKTLRPTVPEWSMYGIRRKQREKGKRGELLACSSAWNSD